MRWLVAVLGAFLAGSIPFGLWAGRLLKGIDVRRHGSGNLGATNVYRVLGPGPGIAVLLLDAAKGVAAVALARAVAGHGGEASPAGDWAGLVGLLGAVLGHSFTPFAGFRGGKGVATAGGAWGFLAPWSLAIALGAWTLVFAATRIVSLASVVAAVILPVATGLLRHSAASDPVLWVAVLTGVLLLVRHRSNLRRLVRGEEKPLDLHGPGGEGRTQ